MFKFIIFERNIEPCYVDCIDYFLFKLSRFKIHWFSDCGEWFVYVGWFGKKSFGIRLSGAGNIIFHGYNKSMLDN